MTRGDSQERLAQLGRDRAWCADLDRCWSVVQGYACFGIECHDCGHFTEVRLGDAIPACCNCCAVDWKDSAPHLMIFIHRPMVGEGEDP